MRRTKLILAAGLAMFLGGCARHLPIAEPGSHPLHAADTGTLRAPRSALVLVDAAPEVVRKEPDVPCWCDDRFKLTTLRLWYFRSFVPDNSDPDTLGVETTSTFGLGRFDVTNIAYFEMADYPIAVPGQPIGNPNPGPGSGAAVGINDLLTAFLFSPKKPEAAHHGPHHFAAGFAAQFPTARHKTLGSGKWSVGPALEYEYECGRFYAAFIALNVFSFAGDEDRKSVNMFMLKPFITYELSRRVKAVYIPYGISVYWNKKAGQRAYVPIGGGFQYDFRVGSIEMGASLQYFYNVIRPDKGTQHDLRLMLEFNF